MKAAVYLARWRQKAEIISKRYAKASMRRAKKLHKINSTKARSQKSSKKGDLA